MAKKMLINADMLLATPRRNEPVAPIAPKIEDEKKQSPASFINSVTSVTDVENPTADIEDKKTPTPVITSVQKGLKVGETRATFIVKEDALEKIKAIAYWDRQNIKDIVQIAIDAYIKEYENAKGAVQPIP